MRIGDAVLLGQLDPGTPEWARARERRVGGSEVAAVLGLSPWESPFSLWWRKRQAIPPIPDNDRLWWGRELEPVIARRFALQHPELDVATCGTFVNDERDWQLISPDRIAWDAAGYFHLVEIKHAWEGEEWGPEDTEDIPVYYRCQVIWAMDVFGVDRCWLVVYFGGGRYREYVIKYDERDAEILRKRVETFLLSIEMDDPPEIDSHPATYQTVRELHPQIDDTAVDLPRELAEEYLAARALAAQYELDAKTATARVAQHLGNGRRAMYGGRCVAMRISKQGDLPHLRAQPLPKPKKVIA
jgi:putative phage-type endonuclease